MRRLAPLLLVSALCALRAVPADAGTLDSWADDIAARAAGSMPPGADVALAVRAREPGAARLAQALEEVVLSRLAANARAVKVVSAAVEARAGGFDLLVELEVAVDAGDAVATGRILSTERDLWRAAAGALPDGAVAATLVARAPIDGELRAYVSSVAPPVPSRRPRRMTFRRVARELDLGAPLLALAAADLDGDARAELIALTTGEVAVLRVLPDGPALIARASLEGPAPLPRPRTPAGALAVVDGQIHARSSERAAGAIFVLSAAALARVGEPRDYPMCPSGSATLVPGRALFQRDAEVFLAAGCGGGLAAVVDAAGALKLGKTVVKGVGTAFAIADVDGDGGLELVSSAWRAPGAPDALAIHRLEADGSVRPAARPTNAPAIAALAAADFDGDGVVDVIAAARTEGDERRYGLWQLE